MASSPTAEKVHREHHQAPDQSTLSTDTSPAPKQAPNLTENQIEDKQKEDKIILPSHSPLAYSNYPPLWSPNVPKCQPRPKSQQPAAHSYTSAESMKAILNTGSSSSKKPSSRFEERDPNNQHQYLQRPDRRYTHPRLNIFGRDIRSPGSHSIFGIGKRK